MSWMRYTWPLYWFNGESQSYVYYNGNGIVDYDDKYEDNESFCELVGRFVEDSTGDEEYALKIVRILAKKLGIEDKLLTTPRTHEEVDRLMTEKCEKTMKELDEKIKEAQEEDEE